MLFSSVKNLQLVSFEVVNKCNLSSAHSFCPSNREDRYAAGQDPMQDTHIFSFLESLVFYGFRGLVGFHFYCEPTLDIERCKSISAYAKELNLKSLLWTNGTCEYSEDDFDFVNRTAYNGTGNIAFNPDGRIGIYEATEAETCLPCYRPASLEMPVDFFGNLHLCCADWKGFERIGNIQHDMHEDILYAWNEKAEAAKNGTLNVCKKCQGLLCSPALVKKDYRLIEEGE